MTPLIRNARDFKMTAPGAVAIVLATGAVIALLVLACRGVPKDDLAEWGIVLIPFVQGAISLLTQARSASRATDSRSAAP